MLVRIVRALTTEEVHNRVRKLEIEHGMTFDEFEEVFLEKKMDRSMVGAYFEWAGLIHAYRRYVESGEFDYVVEEMRELNPGKLALLTPKRLELLNDVASMRPESISDLARKIRRNVKNVHQDLKALERLGFVILKRRDKRSVTPETLVEEITLLIR
ncbi:MAG: ArsR family transcriptional regulator [Candidatus Bathyarchaeota archaeon]|nr:MAG: ArsR family transcriptional regulator [Candidatus Bathyarchaeota archaeon]